MAAVTALDDLDDETASLIVQLQLEDVASLTTTRKMRADRKYALDIARTEARNYAAIRGFDIATRDNEPVVSDNANRPHVECVCTDQIPLDDAYTAPCEHHYCGPCTTRVFQQAMTDERFYPPRCCRQAIPFDDVRDYVDEQVARDFAKKEPELEDQQRVYCHVPSCSTYIGKDFRAAGVGSCPLCSATTCLTCQAASHHGDCPEDEGVKAVERLAEQEGWRRCPSCRRMVELRTGCNHMTCLCTAEFCYVCGSHPWAIPDPLGSMDVVRTCHCAQFDEARLVERVEEIAGREDLGEFRFGDLLEQIRQNHGCTDHRWRRVQGRNLCEECDTMMPSFIMRCRNCHAQRCRRCLLNGNRLPRVEPVGLDDGWGREDAGQGWDHERPEGEDTGTRDHNFAATCTGW
ncbi:hypothetical protein AC578_3059 [Pseudocercospora eumusae]|uniref:RBR-type E3 ubiquitin transferase n=1 Tax=Pseudocercospora eumusae TaxID=321146 RepID=A0A139H3X5_9PEZI|nr:hypothetical protein AC578_3059 [Pseudocercospora eumusae]